MIGVTNTIKNAYDMSTTQYDKILLNNTEYAINNVQYSDDCYYEGNIFGTAIARSLQFEIEDTVNLEKTEFEYLTGVKTTTGIEWISLGKFIVHEVEPNDTTNINTVNAMDYMLKSNVEYISALDYSSGEITILNVLQEACTNAGLELGTIDFPNKNFIVDSNQFEQGTLIRQVIQAIAQISGSVAKIKNDNKLYLINPNSITKVSKKITLNNYSEAKIKRATHPINLVSIGMSDVEGENTVLKDTESIEQDGENSLIINDNPFAYTQKKREQLITELFNAVKGFEYKAFSFECQGLPYLETLDKIQFEDKKGNVYNSYVFRFNYKSPKGLESEIEAPSIIRATVNYQNIPSVLDMLRHTEYRVDKAEGKITLVAEEQEEQKEKVSSLELDVDTIKGQISTIADVTTIAEGYGKVEFSNVNESEPIAIRVHPVLEDITPLYPGENLYPSNELYPHNREIYFVHEDTTNDVVVYNIPKNLYYFNGVYDEFVLDYENQECYIMHRVGLNENTGDKYKLENTNVEYFEYPTLKLKEGNYTITLDIFKNAYIYGRLMSKNIYTSQFATKIELNSEIKQTSSEIMQEVEKKVDEEEFSTKLSLDYESVNIAWNKISDFIKFIAGQLQIKNNSQKKLMALDKTGQHFYDTLENLIGDIGVKDSAISFYINGDKTGNSMEWGIKKTVDNVLKYFPVFKYGEYNTSSGTEFGGSFFFEAPVYFNENKIIFGNLQTSPKLYGTDTGQVFFEKTNCIQIDSNTGTIFKIDENNNIISLLGVLNYGMNNENGFSWDFNGDYLTNMGNVPTSTDIDYLNGNANSPAYLFVSLKNGSTFTLYSNSSDEKLKKNIKSCSSNALKKIMKIQHKEFDWKNSDKHENIGFIAQEIEVIDSNLVNVHEFKNKDGEVEKEYQINVVSMLAMATKAMQEQQLQIEESKQKIKQLEQELKKLKGEKYV